MSNIFETEKYVSIKRKEKISLFMLGAYFFLLVLTMGSLDKAIEDKRNVLLAEESIKHLKEVITLKNELIKEEDKENVDIESINNILDETNDFKKSLTRKTLNMYDLDNHLYIEYYINYHLNKVGISGIKLGTDGYNFINYAEQNIKLKDIVLLKKEDVVYLINEFHKGGFLTDFNLKKEDNLYTVNINLTFTIN